MKKFSFKKLFNSIIIIVCLLGLVITAIYLDIPNYANFLAHPDESITISTSDDDDYTKYTGLFSYILDKNDKRWESSVPDAFYQNLNGEKVINIYVREDNLTSKYEFNPTMGVLKLNNGCLYLKDADRVVFNLLFE